MTSKSLPLVVLLTCSLFASGAPAQSSDAGAELSTKQAQWQSQLWQVSADQTFRLSDVSAPLPLNGALTLERFEVLTSDAQLVINTPNGPRAGKFPQRRFFRGQIDGDPFSTVVLSVSPDGRVRGIVREDGGMLALSSAPDSGLTMRYLESQSDAQPFSCGNDSVDLSAVPEMASDVIETARSSEAVAKAGASYRARIAIDTDHEFYQKFGNETDATDYVLDLVAYASTIYEAEVDTAIELTHLELWDNSSDPWAQTSTICQLYEVGRYWNDNKTGIDRTIVHFLSGKPSNAGVAWVGVLCQSEFQVNHGGSCSGLTPQIDNYGGDYGVTQGVDGNFDPDSPAPVWDIVAFAHEVGHNFNSPHTHCYNGLGGNAAPVDECFNGEAAEGCYGGAQSLPCATSGAGCGTIMSYCQFRSGGLSNIGLTLGQGHPFGVQPERVPTRMSNHVVSRAGSSPVCLAPAVQLTMAAPASVSEGDAFDVVLTLDQSAAADVTVNFGVGANLSGRVGNLSGHIIPAGDTELTVSLTTAENSQDEPDLQDPLFIDSITTTADVATGSPSSQSLTIADDDDPVSVVATIAVTADSVAEGGSIAATVTLDQATTVDVDVSLVLTGDLSGETASSLGPQTIAAGDTQAVFTLVFDNDAVYDGNRVGTVAISSVNSSAATTIGAPASAGLTIVEDESPTPVVATLSLNASSISEGGSVNATVSLDQTTQVDVNVSLSLAGDLVGQTASSLGPQSIAAGETQVVFPLVFDDDGLYTGDRGGSVAIASVVSDAATTVGAPASAALTITEDDMPTPVTATLALSSDSVDEGASVTATVSLDQSTQVAVDVSLDLTADLVGETASSLGPQTIAAGDTEAIFVLSFDDDAVYEGDRLGSVTIASLASTAVTSTGNPSSAALRLIEDEIQAVSVVIGGNARANEGDNIELTVTLDRASAVDVELMLSADTQLPIDPTTSLGPYTINAGETSLNISLATVVDAQTNANVTGTIGLASATGDAGTAIGSPSQIEVTIYDTAPGVIFTDRYENSPPAR